MGLTPKRLRKKKQTNKIKGPKKGNRNTERKLVKASKTKSEGLHGFF